VPQPEVVTPPVDDLSRSGVDFENGRVGLRGDPKPAQPRPERDVVKLGLARNQGAALAGDQVDRNESVPAVAGDVQDAGAGGRAAISWGAGPGSIDRISCSPARSMIETLFSALLATARLWAARPPTGIGPGPANASSATATATARRAMQRIIRALQ
jgi:hypothetical protein